MTNKNKIVFCIVDDIKTYATTEIQTTIKNIADFTIANLLTKEYEVFVGVDEDKLLQRAADSFDYAVVMSPGTEFINGFSFFEALDKFVKQDFFIAGHILDRSYYDAYYELHHQCYVINLNYYNLLDRPLVGVLEKNIVHTQIEPIRSNDNWHDDYTPKFLYKGTAFRKYNNKCHGWNLIKSAFEHNLPVIVFDETIRHNKKHYYPESEIDFYKESEYIEYKFNYCKNEFVMTNNTEWSTGIDDTYNQIVIPASGTLYLDLISQGTVIFYDYNQKSLDYWRDRCPRKEGIEYKFVKTDLLNDLDLITHINADLKTLVNLSNIFSYEGTVAKYSIYQRLAAQTRLVNALNNTVKDITINFTMKADENILSIATWHLDNVV